MQCVKLSLAPPIFCCLKIVFYFPWHFQVFLQYSQCFSNNKNISNHAENVRNFQKLKWHKYLIKYCIIQKGFYLKITNFIFAVSYLKIHPAVHLNTSKSDGIVVKKKSLL